MLENLNINMSDTPPGARHWVEFTQERIPHAAPHMPEMSPLKQGDVAKEPTRNIDPDQIHDAVGVK